MLHGDMLRYVPLHLTALERQPKVLVWIREWTTQPLLTPFSPEGWYREGQGFSWHAQEPVELPDTWRQWSPASAAADACLEALNDSRIKRIHINHVVIIPCLMTPNWQKLLLRMADFVFEVPIGNPLLALL
jgi:hypothetical protein